MRRRKRLNVVRKSSISQAKEELIGSSNDVNQKNHRINEECAQFEENAMVSSLNHQSTMGKCKRLNVVLRSGNSEAEKQLFDSFVEVNQNNRSINKDCVQFGGDTRENAMVSSLKHQNTIGRRTRLNVVRSCGKSLTEQQLIDSSNHFNQNNHDISEECAQLRGDTRENATISSFNHQNTMGRCQRLNAVRKSGKSQAKGQLVDSSNDVNQNNQNEQCANFGGDTRENAMVSTLHQHTMERRKRLNIVRKSGISQAKEQVVDNSNDVNQYNHGKNEVCANFGGDTRQIALFSSLGHQNTTVRRKRSNASQKRGKSQANEQLIGLSNDVNQNNLGINEDSAQFVGNTRENAMVSTLDHQNTVGRRTRLTVVGNSGKSLSKEQLIDSSNHFNQNNCDISEECAQLGGGTRENAMLSSFNHQNTLGRRQRLNVVRKSGKSQAKEQLVDRSNDVNQNNHGINELCAKFRGVNTPTGEIAMPSSLNHQNTSVRCKKLSAAKKRGKSQAKEQIIDSSNDANQNNHGINEECAQFVGNTRENAMVSTIDHQNTMGRRTRLTAVGNSGKSLSKEQLIDSSNHFNQNTSVRRKMLNAAQKRGKSQAKEQIIDSSNDVNQNNHRVNGECAQFGGGEKRVRGYTRMSGVWGIPDGEFILVEVDPFGNPIGLEGKKLLNAIGSLVRKHQYAPINYLSWKDMPVLYITNMLELIESKFLFVPKLTEQTKQILKDNMSSKWRQFKHDLKAKGYDESKTEEEMAADIPDTRVDPSQYRALVHHWCSQEAQKISNINKRNRSKYEDSHCMGTKNLPRFIHETIEANGVQPSRAQIYIETRTRKDGSIVTEKAASVIGELKKHMVEATSSHNPQTTQSSTSWENDIYAKVKGPEKRGPVRCLGKVARPANSNASSAEVKLHKLENLLGSLVSVLQTRFTEDRQINDVLQAIAQEVPNALSTPNDFTSGNQQTTSYSN